MMKKVLFGFLTIFFVSLHAQDPFAGLPGRVSILPNSVIVDKDDVRIRLTVDGRTNHFTLLKSNMFEYIYDSVHPLGHVVPISFSPVDTAAIYRVAEIYVRGKYGAQKNYKMYTPPAVTTLVLSAIPFAGPVLGAAFAVPASKTPVKIQNLGHPSVPLVDHRLYYQGYAEEARRIKARRVWLNFGIGFGICLGAVFLNETTDGALFGKQTLIFNQSK
jgi:hypothetical protein